MYQVRDIIIYPIKGLAGISIQHATAQPIGFENDRRWMLIDQNNQFITQRTQPIMALFRQDISQNQITVTYKESSFSFSLNEVVDELIQTKVWDDTAITQAVSLAADEWFSHHLNQKVRLVKIANDKSRMHLSSATNKNYPVSLADGYPYLIVGEESLRFLNEKLTEQVPMNRFRPNIVVSSIKAHEEDDWIDFKIGSASFTNIKPCGRCNVITVDQATAKINNETLKVLNTYRKMANSVLFGTNLVCNNAGIVCVGDKLEF